MSPNARCSDGDFIQLFKALGAYGVAEKYNMAPHKVYARRRRLEEKLGVPIEHLKEASGEDDKPWFDHEDLTMENGVIVVFGDAHYWPGIIAPAHKIMLQILDYVQPNLVIANGDLFDGARISRHSRIGWDQRPTVLQELEAVQDRMDEVLRAAPNAERWRTKGNHDQRFDTFLSAHAPEFDGVPGTKLDEHLGAWPARFSLSLNGTDNCIIKHRWHSGIHAAYNNVMRSGVTIFTSHTHVLEVRPFTDYRGTRFGVQCGTVSSRYAPQFSDYTENNPVNWQPGFVVAYVDGGKVEHVEKVHVENGKANFGGKRWFA